MFKLFYADIRKQRLKDMIYYAAFINGADFGLSTATMDHIFIFSINLAKVYHEPLHYFASVF